MDDNKRFFLWNRCFTLVERAIFWGPICFIAWCITVVVRAIAGKTTVFDFIVGWFDGSSGLTIFLFGGLSLVTTVWALVERKLRSKKTASLGNRNALNESRIDENRTSSGLLDDGGTNPRDR